MDSTQSTARAAHGDFLYRQTWLARTTDQKWRWAIVGGAALGNLALTAILFLMIMIGLLFFADIMYHDGFMIWSSGLPVTLLSSIALLVWVYVEATQGSRFIGAASTMYSIAADIVRTKSNTRIAHFAYLASGALAVGFACVSWVLRDKREKKLTSTELDVLGSIFSRAKFWKQAKGVYHDIEMLYVSRFLGGQDHKQLSVSYALACKWMLDDPSATGSARAHRRTSIEVVLYDYEGSLPSEVIIRLYEAFGNEEKMNIEAQKIAFKLS